jgi:hypothetical protein
MPVVIPCARCRRPLSLSDEALGREVRCPSCSETFVAEPGPAGRGRVSATALPRPERREKGGPPPVVFLAVLDGGGPGEWEGVWEAALTAEGLRLSRPGRPDVWVAASAGAARLVGGDNFAVSVGGRQLVVTVVQPGVERRRLARDAAACLNGARGAFDPAGYRPPRWPLLAAVVALGAPGAAYRSGAWAEAWPGWVGWSLIGLTAAVGAAALTRRTAWPLPGRLAAGLAAAAAPWGVLLAAFAYLTTAPPDIAPERWRREPGKWPGHARPLRDAPCLSSPWPSAAPRPPACAGPGWPS